MSESKCQAPVLWAELSNGAGGRCLLCASLIKSNSESRQLAQKVEEEKKKGQEKEWIKISHEKKNGAINAIISDYWFN